MFSRKWGKPDGTRIPFDQIAFQKPIGSGPYLIDHYDNGRTISYKRNPDYWGYALPVRVGTNNFAHINYKLYSDPTVRLEAFKAGEYDVLVEYIARSWVRRDIGKRFDSGELIKCEFPQQPNTNPPGSLRANLIKARELLAQAGGPIGTARCAMRRASRSSSRFSTTRACRWSRSRPRSGAICRNSASR